MRRYIIAGVLMAALASACSTFSMHGEANGVTYYMTLDRPAVPGGIPHSIKINMNSNEATTGSLQVDGIDFGRVKSGDHVEVTGDAKVLVNGEERAPGGGGQ